jgi:hypothetical protein
MTFNGYMTVEWLQAHDACKGQIANFRRTFGADKVAITLENLKEGECAGLNYNWLARMLGIKDFLHQAQDRHHRASDHLWKELIKLGEVKE